MYDVHSFTIKATCLNHQKNTCKTFFATSFFDALRYVTLLVQSCTMYTPSRSKQHASIIKKILAKLFLLRLFSMLFVMSPCSFSHVRCTLLHDQSNMPQSSKKYLQNFFCCVFFRCSSLCHLARSVMYDVHSLTIKATCLNHQKNTCKTFFATSFFDALRYVTLLVQSCTMYTPSRSKQHASIIKKILAKLFLLRLFSMLFVMSPCSLSHVRCTLLHDQRNMPQSSKKYLQTFFATSFAQIKLVGLGGLEPPASPLSGVRSNQLSYRPNSFAAIFCVTLRYKLYFTQSCTTVHSFTIKATCLNHQKNTCKTFFCL